MHNVGDGDSLADASFAADATGPVLFARRRFPLAFAAFLALLVAFTAAVLFVPGLLFVAISPAADRVINTFATLSAGAVAALAWIRFREAGLLDSLFQSAAFLVLFTGGAIVLLLVLTGVGADFGFDRSAPGQAPLYLWTMQRLLAALLLLIGALSTLTNRRWAETARRKLPVLALLGPTALVMLAGSTILLVHDRLPALIPASTLVLVTQPLDQVEPVLISEPMLISQMTIAGLFLAAGLAYGGSYLRRRRTPEQGRTYDAYLSIGLVVAAFGQVHFAIVPGAYGELVTSGDLLRVTFYAIIGLGVAAAARQDLRELRQANIALHRLRAADNERIALEERARLAREVHDGLVQDLWLARLTHGQLSQALDQAADLSPEARLAAKRIDGMLEDALAEARQAVVSLQHQEDPSFGSLLRRFVEDYADRFGIEIECEVRGRPVMLPGQAQAEVLRICREAINNARKHADASLVTVTLEADDRLIRLTVADNGRGFDPSQPRRRGFGLDSMQVRAAGLGGQLAVDSEPMNGTRVTLELPQREKAADTASAETGA